MNLRLNGILFVVVGLFLSVDAEAQEGGGIADIKKRGAEYLESIDNLSFSYRDESFVDRKPSGMSFDVETTFSGERFLVKRTGRPYLAESVGPNFAGVRYVWAFDGETYGSFASSTGILSNTRDADSVDAGGQVAWGENPLLAPFVLLFPDDRKVRSRHELVQFFLESDYEVIPAGEAVQVRIRDGGAVQTWREVFWQDINPFPYHMEARPVDSPNAQVPGENGVPSFAWQVTQSVWKIEKLARISLGGTKVNVPEVTSYVVYSTYGKQQAATKRILTVDLNSIRALTADEREAEMFQISGSITDEVGVAER